MNIMGPSHREFIYKKYVDKRDLPACKFLRNETRKDSSKSSYIFVHVPMHIGLFQEIDIQI